MSAELNEGPEDLLEEEVTIDKDGEVKSGPRYPKISAALVGNKYATGGPGGWGDKSKFKQEYIREASIAARAGMTEHEIADLFDVTTKGLQLWKYQYPELREALAAGKEIWDNRVEASFAQVAVGYDIKAEKIFMTKDGDIVRAEYIKHYPPNHAAAAIWLANRKPKEWTKRALENDSGNVTVNVTVQQVRATIQDKLERLAGAGERINALEIAPVKDDGE